MISPHITLPMDTQLQVISDLASKTNFSNLDWGIVVIYLLGSIVIGWIGRSYVGNMTDFIGAGRSIGTRLGVASMAGTEMGLITVMYSAQKGFTGYFAAFHIAILAGLVAFFVGATGFIVAKLRSMEVLTIPEFYEKRFSKDVRILGGTLLVLGGVLNMGLFLKVGSMFIVGITGMSNESNALMITMTVLICLVLFYTVLGGMVSVVITDYIQFVVLSFGVLLTTWLCVNHLGWETIVTTIKNSQGENGFDPFKSSEFGWDYITWMVFLGLVNCAIWPTAIARALMMKSTNAVKKQFMWSAIPFTIRQMIPIFWGICAYVFIVVQAPDLKEAFYPDPGGGVTASDNLFAMPVFLGRILPVGILGLVSAAMIAAFMSTHDSYLLCWSSVITQDIIAPLKGHLSQKSRILITRLTIVCLGVYVWLWGLFYKGSDDIWDYMAITGAVYFSGAFALLWGGLYWKKGSAMGARFSLIAGFFAVLGLGPVKEFIGMVNAEGDSIISSSMLGLIVIVASSVLFVIGSLLFPDQKRHEVSES